MAPTRRAMVVECEEESDEGSLWKRFAIFRSGLVFGRDTAVQRSIAKTEPRPVASLLEPCVESPQIAPINTTAPQTDTPPRAPPSAVAEATASSSHVQQQQQQQPPTDIVEKKLESNSPETNNNAETVVGDIATPNDTMNDNRKDDSLTIKPDTQTETAVTATAMTTTTTTEQPLHVPSLPFTLGPYPVPLGGLPHIREETPSLCSDLTKHPSICSERTLKTKPAMAKKLVRFLSGTLMQEMDSESDNDGDGGIVVDEDDQNVVDALESPVADSSQDAMSALGMGSFGGQKQSRRGVNKQDNEVDSKDSSFYTRTGAPDSQFRHYNVDVDPTQEDRGADIPLFSAARPHMRGFHFAWMSFFVAFFMWFAMTPLLAEIARSLDFTREEIFLSSVLAVLSSGFTRVVIGPLNDAYGPRWVMACTLVTAAVPTALAGWLLQSTISLYLLRFFIGIAGSSFVTCQYWTLSMFTHEIAGTANALAAGWGNLGGGVAQIIMGSVLFPIAKIAYGGGSCFGDCAASRGDGHNDDDVETLEYDRASDLAWRTILIFPAVFSLVMAYCVIRYSDDTPKGSIKRRRQEQRAEQMIYSPVLLTIWENLKTGSRNWNTFLLAFQYGCSFGVEITMTQAAAWYFMDEFGQTTESAAAIASAFGWMNLFARGMGGYYSDWANDRFGLRGRLVCLVVCFLAQGCLIILFENASTLGGAIVVMVFFSIFVQASEGTVFGIVPYVDKSVVGSIAGLVGAGGNLGGACFSLLFARFTYRTAFLSIGVTVIVSALMSTLIQIPGHKGLLVGSDSSDILKRRQRTKPPMIILVPATQNTESHAYEGATFEMDVEGASHAT